MKVRSQYIRHHARGARRERLYWGRHFTFRRFLNRCVIVVYICFLIMATMWASLDYGQIVYP